MKNTTLCFLLKDGDVLLAMKKRGFGVGKWNGIGGKLNEGEDVLAAAAREVKEEIGVEVSPADFQSAGTLEFIYKDHSEWHQLCNIFTVHSWKGEPAESDEMRPQWFSADKLPFEAMWVDDPYWLPRVLDGEKIKAIFHFTDQGSVLVGHDVTII